ncbi:peroxidase-like protein [Crassostrea virginica]
MREKFLLFTYLLVLIIPGLGAQNLDSVIQNAVDSAFGQIGPRSQGLGMPRPGTAFRGDFAGQAPPSTIPAQITERTPGPTTSGEGSSAINSLNRFSQNNAPEMNQLLDNTARSAATAAKGIASSLPAASAGLSGDVSRENLRTVATDPQITRSFQEAVRRYCYEIPLCDEYDPYRTADGSCNNLYNPLLGKSFTPQARIVSNAYDDFTELPRTLTYDGQGTLPSARVVSNAVFAGTTPTSATHSTFLTHFGQFIDHDVISTPSMKDINGNDVVDCCHPGVLRYECFPIRVPLTDPVFLGRTCMNMVRHAAAIPLQCTNGVREQQNQRSSFIDGTAIYGWHRTRELELRQRSGGRLLESDLISGLLPRDTCNGVTTAYHCFKAGDHRQSETPTLTVMHTTWLRRHNLIADALRQATGITHDETLFQEAKRIVVAELQHIAYNEFLPEVLDNRHMTIFNLRSRRVGHDNTYNPSVDPRTYNAFGAAVLRMGHSLVRNVVGHDNGRGGVRTHLLKDHFERPDLMFWPPYGYEYMARWMSKAPKSRSDRTIVDGLRNRLFEGPPGPQTGPRETLAFDLGALNVQRGREHGLPPYNVFRRFCGRRPAYHFRAGVAGGLVDHTPQNAARLASVYRSPHDIDLFAGGMSETPLRGGILGPTFSCLLAYQFSLYKHGDRFWYENNDHQNPLAAFTADQLAQIKRITESKVLCSVVKNDRGDVSYQPRMFVRPDIRGNRQRPCSVILNGNRLGFDIRPFANQLILLRGRRTGRSRNTNPLTDFDRAFSRRPTSLIGPRRTAEPPVNLNFEIPAPGDVLG